MSSIKDQFRSYKIFKTKKGHYFLEDQKTFFQKELIRFGDSYAQHILIVLILKMLRDCKVNLIINEKLN